MIEAVRPSTGLLRRVWLTMATLAIALKIIIPPGFMVAPPTNDLPFLVLCTAQGVTVLADDGGPPAHDGDNTASTAMDAPCLFAGLATTTPPPILTDVGVLEFVAHDERPHAVAPDLAPGRGLTGPPLPARGPPAQLI